MSAPGCSAWLARPSSGAPAWSEQSGSRERRVAVGSVRSLERVSCPNLGQTGALAVGDGRAHQKCAGRRTHASVVYHYSSLMSSRCERWVDLFSPSSLSFCFVRVQQAAAVLFIFIQMYMKSQQPVVLICETFPVVMKQL